MVSIDPRSPVIIGVGQANRRVDREEEAVEPVELMVEAARTAIDDAGLAQVPAGRLSIMVPRPLSWRYRDPGALVAQRLVTPVHDTVATVVSGSYGQALVLLAAERIQRGEIDAAIITGADTWRTRTAAKKAGIHLPWTRQDDDVAPDVDLGRDDPPMAHPGEVARGIIQPVEVYPMYESALRAAAGRSLDEHLAVVAGLWSRFSVVASANPHAWIRERYTPEEIAAATPDNRMIGYPYTKRMNSNNAVEQGAAILVCAAEHAVDTSRERWVFPLAGATAHDHWYLSERADLQSSPALRLAGRAALDAAELGIDDVAHVDLYSCFPSAVEIGAAELGLGLDRQLTVTGGMSFAGGPWNSYTLHGMAAMVDVLRSDPGSMGLCTGNGGFTTKHAIGLYSTEPRGAGFRRPTVQTEVDALPRRPLDPEGSGEITIEAYTVMHDRDGRPERAPIAGLLADGCRIWGHVADADTMAAMTREEFVGRRARVATDGNTEIA